MESNNNKLKEALNQSVPEWDESGMWDSIEETLPTENRRKPWLLWFMSGLGVVAVGFGVWWTIYSPHNLESLQSTDSLTKVEIEKTISEKGKKEKNLKEDLPLDEKVKAEGNIKDTQSTLKRAKKNVQDSRSTKLNQNVVAAQKSQAKKSVNQADQQVDQQIEQQRGDQIGSERPSRSITKQSIRVANQSRDRQLDYSSLIQKEALGSLIFLDRIDASFLQEQSKKQKDNPHIDNDNLLELEDQVVQLSPRHSIATNFGVMKTLKSLDATNQIDWVSAKESQEELLETIDLNIQYQRLLSRHIQVGIGIGYSQVNERLTWRDTVLAMIDTSYTSSLQTVSTQYDILKKETPNAYQTIYIPLYIGYVVTQGKWRCTASVGGNISIMNRHRGKVITTDLKVINSELDKSLLNKNLGIHSLNTSILGAYQLKENLYVSAGLKYQFGLQNRLADNSTQLKYGGYGVQIGLQYQLDR